MEQRKKFLKRKADYILALLLFLILWIPLLRLDARYGGLFGASSFASLLIVILLSAILQGYSESVVKQGPPRWRSKYIEAFFMALLCVFMLYFVSTEDGRYQLDIYALLPLALVVIIVGLCFPNRRPLKFGFSMVTVFMLGVAWATMAFFLHTLAPLTIAEGEAILEKAGYTNPRQFASFFLEEEEIIEHLYGADGETYILGINALTGEITREPAEN